MPIKQERYTGIPSSDVEEILDWQERFLIDGYLARMKGEKILHLSPTVSNPNPKNVFIGASHLSLPSLLSILYCTVMRLWVGWRQPRIKFQLHTTRVRMSGGWWAG
jgi:hypothetical protein